MARWNIMIIYSLKTQFDLFFFTLSQPDDDQACRYHWTRGHLIRPLAQTGYPI